MSFWSTHRRSRALRWSAFLAALVGVTAASAPASQAYNPPEVPTTLPLI